MHVYIPSRNKVAKIKEGFTVEQVKEKYPDAFECEYPSDEQLFQAISDGVCETPCGCSVEPDGHCEHDNPSWLLVLGLI